jgi:alpha-galactosidase
VLGDNAPEIDVKAFGLNHFTWFSEISDKETGRDLYPEFIEKEKNYDPEFEKLSRFMFHQFGLFPTSGDGHLGEYIPYAHEMMSTKGYDFDADEAGRIEITQYIEKLADPASPLDEDMLAPSGEKAFAIIRGITYNTNELIDAVNIPNDGYISNLPQDAIVEVPAVVSRKGLHGLGMGPLPRGIAALCSGQINVQHLVVDAGATGDRKLVMQALLADPNVPSAEAAVGIYEELMEINKPYLPQFK